MGTVVPKSLINICGLPILNYSLDQLNELGFPPPIIIIPGEITPSWGILEGEYQLVSQNPHWNAGPALSTACQQWAKQRLQPEDQSGSILCIGSDRPLTTVKTLQILTKQHEKTGADITLLTSHHPPQLDMAMIQRDSLGNIRKITQARNVSESACGPTEGFSDIYCFRTNKLSDALDHLSPTEKETITLIDLVNLALSKGDQVEIVQVEDPKEILAIDTNVDLAEAETEIRRRIAVHWMLNGVRVTDPASIYIDARVNIQPYTCIHPNTYLYGHTTVASNCQLGPNTIVRDSAIGESSTITGSIIESSSLGVRSRVGPFSHIRPGTKFETDVHIGTHVEIKASTIGSNTKIGHFSYIGDSSLGSDVNFGAGAVTCNFDGAAKHETIIEDRAFIGSGSMLIAPIQVGRGAVIGAGSVVTKDVSDGTTVIGAPAHVHNVTKKS